MRIFKIISVLFIFVFLVYIAIFFNSYYSLVGAFALIFILIFDVILFFLPFDNISIDIVGNSGKYKKGEKAVIEFIIKNKRYLPVSSCKFDVEIKNNFYKKNSVKIKTSLPIFVQKKIYLPLNLTKSGTVKIRVDKVEYSDLLGLFKKYKNISTVYSVISMPIRTNKTTIEYGNLQSDELPAANKYLSSNGDINGYKEYILGDRNYNINWKLYSRTNTLYVKEFERASADEAVVLLDMNVNNLDKAIDIVYNIDYSCKGFTLLWLPCGNEEFESAYILDKESMDNAIYRIFDSVPDVLVNKALTEYKRLYKESKIMYVSDKMELL